jgi:hypothetical protein
MVADLKGLGRNDLTWADPVSNKLLVAFDDGEGGYTKPLQAAAGAAPASVCPIDLDNDKDVDLVATNFGFENAFSGGNAEPAVTVTLNDGDGNFGPATPYEVGAGPAGLTEADLNSDGVIDLIAVSADTKSLTVFEGLGGGAFRPGVAASVGGTPRGVAAGDFDNDVFDAQAGHVIDGDVDIAVLITDEKGDPSLTLFRNDSTNEQIVLSIILGAEELIGLPSALTSSDADGDGIVDLLFVGTGEEGGGFVSVVQAVPVQCPGDFGGDGNVDGSDVGALLAAWGPADGGPYDLTGDGLVDGLDLSLLLAAWGPCGVEID